jgi:hypothetical protein
LRAAKGRSARIPFQARAANLAKAVASATKTSFDSASVEGDAAAPAAIARPITPRAGAAIRWGET